MTHGSDRNDEGQESGSDTSEPCRPLREILVTAMLLAPVLAAIWVVPWFVTQDGLTHLYNAWIIAASTAGDSAFSPYYEVHWRPLPNWAGHLALIGLLRVVSPWAADRIVMSASLLGIAVATVWLRARVVGGRGSFAACALSALLALSFSWLMGFSSFQLGACLFPITLGVWWKGRDGLRAGRMAGVSALLILGYFGHLVSLGLTVCAMMFLAIVLPGGSRWARLWRTGVSLAPLGGLGVVYLKLSRQGGPMHPKFPAPGEFLSISGWVRRLGWVDPISVAIKVGLPFTDHVGPLYAVFSPAVWLALAGLLGLATAWRGTRERRAWQALGAILVMGGVFGPDSLGPGHGDYLPQRLALLGLVALVPTFDRAAKSWTQRAAAGAIVVALVLQTVVVWDYALDSQRKVAQMVAIGPSVGRGQRVATLISDLKTRFRPNAALHADSWLGISEGAVLWSNYETRYYYFPVQFRPELARPDSFELEQIALRGGSDEAEERWARVLETYRDAIDRVIVWRDDPGLDAITERWYELVVRRGDARVYRRREGR
ncbi:MAG: hypothetical protein P4L85_00705 [Paludisphaera borealis]|uniref:hypothetical protein n=1 Tax=Paludisphaera borealis TaxID=1387353 RepID=UPI00284CC8BD|nr:hypothetical protein [Paludisphaera borealis]MDR3617840.1 hypothetical protein [Paludisphaera borealis]